MPLKLDKKAKITREFSRFAYQYDKYNTIQSQVAVELVNMIYRDKYENIIDIGCGSGEIYKNIIKKNIYFDKFFALDASGEMLELHPSSDKVNKIIFDFNSKSSFSNLKDNDNSIIVSSSALQWSSKLDFTIGEIYRKSDEVYFSFFTSGTFKTLHKEASVKSPIYSSSTIKKHIDAYFDAKYILKDYRIYFDSTKEMFRYIKRSGVSGGEKQLNYKEMKHLMKSYSLNYLEFEVLFVKAKRSGKIP